MLSVRCGFKEQFHVTLHHCCITLPCLSSMDEWGAFRYIWLHNRGREVKFWKFLSMEIVLTQVLGYFVNDCSTQLCKYWDWSIYIFVLFSYSPLSITLHICSVTFLVLFTWYTVTRLGKFMPDTFDNNASYKRAWNICFLARSPLCNSLWPIDAIWWHICGSALPQVMACCLMATSHYLNQCWLNI